MEVLSFHREISRCLTPHVKERMIPGYRYILAHPFCIYHLTYFISKYDRAAAEVVGAGTFARMKVSVYHILLRTEFCIIKAPIGNSTQSR